MKLERHGADLTRIVREQADAGAAPPVAPPASAASDVEARSWHEEQVAEARRMHPRAYEPWTDGEDARLRALADEGTPLDAISRTLERQPNAVRIRAERLGVVVVEAEAAATL
jgi:hypothetical protein